MVDSINHSFRVYNNYMHNRPYFIINVEAAIHDGSKFLLIRRSKNEDHSAGTLSLVGGKVDHMACSPLALETTLRREVYEEVGLQLGAMNYVESKSFIMDTGEWCLSICFYCQDFTGHASIKSPQEVDEVLWLTQAELDANPACPPWTKQSIAAVVRDYSDPKK